MKLSRIFILLLLNLILVSCNSQPVPIEADDFGYPKVTVYAKGQNVTGAQSNQLSEWSESAYVANGNQMTVMVYNNYAQSMYGNNFSQWGGWLCAGETSVCSSIQDAGQCYIPPTPCASGETCDLLPYCSNARDMYETISNAPCIFAQGQGLYMLLPDMNNDEFTDPNQSFLVNSMPTTANMFTQALWQSTGLISNGALAYGFVGVPTSPNGTANSTYVGATAYFKILDRYYDDNSGFYLVALKSGFYDKNGTPIANVINYVTTTLNAASKTMFEQITHNSSYLSIVRLVLVLYMMLHGILFVGGVINMTQKELIYLFMKLIVVIQLLATETSWSIFNGYLFSFFTNGLTEIVGIVTYTVTNGASGPTFFDQILDLLFSYETTMKIMALFFSLPVGFIVIIMIYGAFALFTYAIAQAVVLYMLAYMATSMLIVIAPIFIVFLLFKQTKSLFEGWLNQFAIYFFQPVFVMASLCLIANVIIYQMYRLLGYPVCFINWPNTSNGFALFTMPKICSIHDTVQTMRIPGYGYWNSAVPDQLYAPYTFSADRYVDLPFLDMVADASLIKAFQAPALYLNSIELQGGFILLILTFVMVKFNEIVPDLARGIAGASDTAMGGTNLGAAASGAVGAGFNYAQTKAGNLYSVARSGIKDSNSRFNRVIGLG